MVGEVFRIAFERRHTFDGSRDTARPWLYGIATNVLAKHRRGEARRLRAVARLASQRLAVTDPEGGVDDAIDAAGLWDRVAGVVAALPEPERDALLLHAWEGLSYDDVADALGIPVAPCSPSPSAPRDRRAGKNWEDRVVSDDLIRSGCGPTA